MITSLAPMESVTDSVFRQIIIKCGRPDIFYTEFTNCDALNSKKGREIALQNFKYIDIEKPLVAQIWGSNPNTYPDAIKICIDLGFSGININMGCPVPKVLKSGGGGKLIQDKETAIKIIEISQETIRKGNSKMPFSIKTRIGFNDIELDWIELLLKQQLDELVIHTRTVRELSKVPANWNIFNDIIPLRNSISPDTKIIGNGDIDTKEQLNTYEKLYGVDGAMVGRGIFKNPWIFNQNINIQEVTNIQRISLLKEHILLFRETWGNTKNLEILKKYFKIYLRGNEELNTLRNKLMELHSYDDFIQTIERLDYQS